MDDVLAQPVGCGVNREHAQTKRRPPFIPVATYAVAMVAGSSISSSFIFTVASVARQGSRPVLWGAAGAVAALAAILQLSGRVAPLPERKAQVPRRWTTWRRKAATAAAFGFVLGMGFFTLLHHASIYVLALLVALAPSLASAVIVGALYGSIRAAVALVAWGRRGASVMYLFPGGTVVNRGLAVAASSTFAGAAVLVFNL
jgi:hypothetical protein